MIKSKHLPRNMFLVLWLVVATVAVCCSVFISCEFENSDFAGNKEYEHLLSRPLKTLVEKGSAYYDAGHLDSAYVVYTAVSSRYTSSMSDEDKKLCERACNNAAYISHLLYNDYPQACFLLIKGLEIADEVDAKEAYPYIYINLGNLMCATGNWNEGMKYQIKSMDAALQTGDTVNYLKGAANLFTEALLENKIDEYKDVLCSFPKLHSSGELWTYTTKIHIVAKAQLAGDHTTVENTLRSLADEDNSGIAPRERLVFFRQFILARTEEFRGNTRRAIDILREIERSYPLQPELKSYLYKDMSTAYRSLGMSDSAADYRLLFAELTDSLRSDRMQNSIYDMKRAYENRVINIRMEGLLQERQALVQTIWIVSGFTTLVFVLFIIIIISRRKAIKAKREIYERNRELLREIDSHRATSIRRPVSDISNSDPAHRQEAEQVDMETLRRIKEVLETSTDIYMPDFSVEKLASMLGLPVRKVSKTINDGIGKNFATTLQTYRIREACRRLSDTETYANLTIEAIAESLGFKSRSNFNTVFKKLTGLTPAAWQKIARKK